MILLLHTKSSSYITIDLLVKKKFNILQIYCHKFKSSRIDIKLKVEEPCNLSNTNLTYLTCKFIIIIFF